jgi:hypothetical protein
MNSIFRTETRAVATDPVARLRFRRYWSFLSPGIILIRRAMLAPVRAEAERRARDPHDRACPRAWGEVKVDYEYAPDLPVFVAADLKLS